MSHDNRNNNYDPLQAQLQGQAELQAQLEAQLQAQGQGQGQAQGQAEDQSQSQHQDSENLNLNGNGNANGNLNVDLNGNGNFNANGNYNDNSNVNENVNHTDVSVCVTVDTPPLIDMSDLSQTGAQINIPEAVTQYVDGGGNNVLFQLDQINNLQSNGHVGSPTISYDGGGAASIPGLGGLELGGGQGFTINTHIHGGDVRSDVGPAGDNAVTTADASVQSTVDAFSQSIVLGANLQYNQFTVSVVGHDSMTATHGDIHNHS